MTVYQHDKLNDTMTELLELSMETEIFSLQKISNVYYELELFP